MRGRREPGRGITAERDDRAGAGAVHPFTWTLEDQIDVVTACKERRPCAACGLSGAGCPWHDQDIPAERAVGGGNDGKHS